MRCLICKHHLNNADKLVISIYIKLSEKFLTEKLTKFENLNSHTFTTYRHHLGGALDIKHMPATATW